MLFRFFLIIFLQLAATCAVAQPEFKGGTRNLYSFIANNLIYPEYSRQNCLQGTVQISFKVDKQGRVYQSEVQSGYGTDLDVEALRLVRLTSKRWVVPAGHDTTTALVLPINFSLKEYKCEQRPKDEINAAIRAYKARRGLTDVVTNYYDKKAEGKHNAADEQRILELKTQLGFDEKFIGRLLKQAQSKLKQGDKQGACEDLIFVRSLGSDKADTLLSRNCN